jgi:hypothetical protein
MDKAKRHSLSDLLMWKCGARINRVFFRMRCSRGDADRIGNRARAL